ncbi:MAG TPA: tetratricopeptide repeat protein [Solirubrobacteraceae bacterium]|nr:tetratricopeptide repeat protein [Solirubrobacteraceae bacterium]
MTAAWERRVAVVVAGGGYGKTTALRQLASADRSRWLTLKAQDRAVETFAPRVADAVGASGGYVSAPVAAIGATDRRSLAEGQATAICESLDTESGELLLVLDDVDHLRDGDSSSQFLSTLCLQAPPRLHLVLSGRNVPSLGLGSARGRGELMELNAPDLAFSPEETTSLLVERLGPPAACLAQKCWDLTAGWPAALQLIADRLARLDPARWEQTLEQLRLRHGPPWREFAADLIEREEPGAQRILAVASIAPVVDGDLLAALGIPAVEAELDNLQARGLLVMSGERDVRTLSPVLAGAVADRLAVAEAAEIRQQAAAWLERSGRLDEAFECTLAGPADQQLSFLARQGEKLVTCGYGSRVAGVLRQLGTGDGVALDAVLAEALVAVGDWDGALDVFRAMQHNSRAPLTPAIAWRFGALLYLRSDTEAAWEVLEEAYRDGAGSSDDALVAAWLSSTLWGRGQIEEAESVAEVALAQAQASGDPSACAAAHVAVALAAASRGDRERNERHYRQALNAAAKAGDSVQIARIHANLSSRATEEGDFSGAIKEADLAISAAAGHNLFSALAMSNKAEALMRTGELEEARALLLQAIEMFASLGSLLVCESYTQLGALDAERGDFARARKSLERAYRLAEEAEDVHARVVARAGLAGLLADDDPDTARAYAKQAVEQATSLERAHALCALSWVELSSGNRAEAASLSMEAQAESRRTGDSPSLARALELGAAASHPVDQTQLQTAVELWREVGDPIAAQRADLMLAACRGDVDRVKDLREELARRGVHPELGPAGLVVRAREKNDVLAITTLGRFSVSRNGQAIPLVAWQSRKARDLLKMLVARRGRALTRDAAAEALWPNEEPARLPNRLSVALSTLRRVLDPERAHGSDHLIAADNQSLALRMERVSVDVAAFFDAAAVGVALASEGDWIAAERKLRQADGLYTGDFLEEDLYEDWAVDCREEARSAAQEVTRLLARAASSRQNEEEAIRYLRRLLERDPYDADAWAALVGAQLRLRRYGEARRQHSVYARRMAELAIPPLPLARTVDARP